MEATEVVAAAKATATIDEVAVPAAELEAVSTASREAPTTLPPQMMLTMGWLAMRIRTAATVLVATTPAIATTGAATAALPS